MTTSMRRSEATAVDRARRDVLNLAHHWRRRAAVTRSSPEFLVGTVVVASSVLHVVRRGLALAEESLGLDHDAVEPEP